ncbi:MAG: nucleotide exchange factor GrpE [Chromatiales bacterium 21-64-14]|nr:MAG: nucleotide exchange factor GrpE [Chromatiales bacterium 21-64-14]HQU16164.1 nucleotide exchange factor GrpE [Gammaproteobacteria bacterium]
MQDEENRSTAAAGSAGNGTEAGSDSGTALEERPLEERPVAELVSLLEEARAKAEEHWNQFLRLKAEMENFRRRSERELENAHKYAVEKFATELLAVRDSLEMGLSVAQEGVVDAGKLKEGSELTLKLLSQVFEKFGIRALDPAGTRFDPSYHEAMAMQERADLEPNTVLNVVQKGYTLNDRLIRPAMVIVSKAASGNG